jgi:hypothetical protein
MDVTKLKDENNLTELIDRLFDLQKSTVGRREIAARIAEANPQLELKRGSLATRLHPGELIAVPEIEGAVTTRDVQPISVEAARAVLRETKRLIVALPDAVQQDATALRAVSAETKATLNSAAFKRAIRNDQRAKDQVKEIKGAFDDRAALAAARVDTAQEAIAEARQVIERMLKRLP